MIVEFRVTIFQTASSIAETIAKVRQYFLLVLLTALTTTPYSATTVRDSGFCIIYSLSLSV